MKPKHEIMIVLTLVSLSIFGNALLDVGHTVYFGAMANAWYFGVYIEPMLTNGFWEFSALAAYHAGWYMQMTSNIILAFFSIHLIEKNRTQK